MSEPRARGRSIRSLITVRRVVIAAAALILVAVLALVGERFQAHRTRIASLNRQLVDLRAINRRYRTQIAALPLSASSSGIRWP
jgi:hypothetical protein